MTSFHGLFDHLSNVRAAGSEYVDKIDALGYHPQGPEVSAIADAIAHQHRNCGGFFDCGTYMETARDALNKLSAAGFILVPVPGSTPTQVGAP